MKCPICSAKISDTDAFCPNCGSAVKSETSGYMDSIDTSNLGENVGFGKRNTTGAQPVNAVPQQNYAQGQQSLWSATERLRSAELSASAEWQCSNSIRQCI